MTDEIKQIKFTSATPVPGPSHRDYSNPVRLQKEAREMAARNYNTHRPTETTEHLRYDDVYITSTVRIGDSWKIEIKSETAKGLIWIVTFDSSQNETSIEIYKKIGYIRSGRRRPREQNNNSRDRG